MQSKTKLSAVNKINFYSLNFGKTNLFEMTGKEINDFNL